MYTFSGYEQPFYVSRHIHNGGVPSVWLTIRGHLGDERDLSAEENVRNFDHRGSGFHRSHQCPRQHSIRTSSLLKHTKKKRHTGADFFAAMRSFGQRPTV